MYKDIHHLTDFEDFPRKGLYILGNNITENDVNHLRILGSEDLDHFICTNTQSVNKIRDLELFERPNIELVDLGERAGIGELETQIFEPKTQNFLFEGDRRFFTKNVFGKEKSLLFDFELVVLHFTADPNVC